MPALPNPLGALKQLSGYQNDYYYSLLSLEENGVGSVKRLPVSIRIMLESVLRKCDGKRIKEQDIKNLLAWNKKENSSAEVPFTVSRVILQDFTGVPLLVDLAAMRDAVEEKGYDPRLIEPIVPVDLVIDHSVQVDCFGESGAFLKNLEIEFDRNKERYEFLKWGQQAFETLKVIPPGIGIVHQVNLEYIATVVVKTKIDEGFLLYPDTLVGTDSHTTMVNGLGVVAWGVGGIEAESAMLGQPVFLQMPEVIGVHLSGQLRDGVTATDLTLRVTELLRQENVVGKFVEFFGEGACSLTVADRATIGNMAPEYGATMGFFPADEKTMEYLSTTGREKEHIELVEAYLRAQGIFGIPKKGEVDYTKVIELDLQSISSSVSGPKRPQDRLEIADLPAKFRSLLSLPAQKGGYGISEQKQQVKVCLRADEAFSLGEYREVGGKRTLDDNGKTVEWDESEMVTNRPLTEIRNEPVKQKYEDDGICDIVLAHGSIVIAAITSCTNTSNPCVMLGAGLLAKKAVERGLKVNSKVKTSLAPGSRVVTDYLNKSGLQPYLDTLGFNLVAYGCTTCIGNSGPLDESIEKAIKEYELVVASVLSGNRNFEARIHGSVKANFLMSPPLVVAYAIAGRVDLDLSQDPLGHDGQGKPVYLKEIWPSNEELKEAMNAVDPEMYKNRYSTERIYGDNPVWKEISSEAGAVYEWNEESTYIQKPPYFDGFSLDLKSVQQLRSLRALAIFGDSVTTDHISPAGGFLSDSPAGEYLLSKGTPKEEFNSYGSRRGNHDVMMRGTFANVRIRNQMADGKEGGFTKLMPEKTVMRIFDAAERYAEKGVPLIIFAGADYGMGSSRDWAAKGSKLLGVQVVVAKSFERIHRSNLIGMGVLPLEFSKGEDAQTLGITGEEEFNIEGLQEGLVPGGSVILEILRVNGKRDQAKLHVRIDTPVEVDYYMNGGIMPFVLRQILSSHS